MQVFNFVCVKYVPLHLSQKTKSWKINTDDVCDSNLLVPKYVSREPCRVIHEADGASVVLFSCF